METSTNKIGSLPASYRGTKADIADLATLAAFHGALKGKPGTIADFLRDLVDEYVSANGLHHLLVANRFPRAEEKRGA